MWYNHPILHHNNCRRCNRLFWTSRAFKVYHLWCNPLCWLIKLYNFILDIVDSNDYTGGCV
jgi:hypothetical protein